MSENTGMDECKFGTYGTYFVRGLDVEVDAEPIHGFAVLFRALVLHDAATNRSDSRTGPESEAVEPKVTN